VLTSMRRQIPSSSIEDLHIHILCALCWQPHFPGAEENPAGKGRWDLGLSFKCRKIIEHKDEPQNCSGSNKKGKFLLQVAQ